MKIIIIRSLVLLMLTSVLVGCHASLLMNNGEIPRPQGNKILKDTVEEFNKEQAPTNVNATASFYTEKIGVRWKAVKGADYYTLEKTSHVTPQVPDDAIWKDLDIAVSDTSYEDKKVQPSVYYSYRVTPHTFLGEIGATSASSTGTILTSPVKITASKGSNPEYIFLTWEQTPNAEEYMIFKSESSTVLGIDSEYIATVEVNPNSFENIFAYPIIKGKEEGKELYFAIKASNNNVDASVSLPRSGFTRVLGAPQKPVSIISKGEFTDSIVVQFFSPTEDASSPFDYVIKRSYPGVIEAEVFSTANGDTLVKNEDGYYVYEDTDVNANIEYTYSILASNDKGEKSEAMVDTGYVLSPVKSLVLKADAQDKKIGYKAVFELPVGFNNATYVYKVTTLLKDGSAGPSIDIPSAEIGSANLFYEVLANPEEDEEKKEIRSVSIVVSNGKYDSVLITSNKIKDLDYAITEIKATKNDRPKKEDVPNSYGVYPVRVNFITFSSKDQILIRKGSDGSVSSVTISGKFYLDTDTVPLVTYDYYIDNTDELGRTIGGVRGEILHANNGKSYGSITPALYKAIFESVSLKPWEKQDFVPTQYKNWWKSTSLAIMIGYGNASDLSTQMKALGNAEANDHSSRSGLCQYSASMKGMGGQIYFTYTNFGESENFYINGNYEMHVNASGNGTAGSNTSGFEIKGMYPGHCSLEKISVGSKNFKGAYVFTYNYDDGTEKFEVGV